MNNWLFLNNLLPATAEEIAANKPLPVASIQRPTTYNWMTDHKRWWDINKTWQQVKNQDEDQCAEDTYVACKIKNHGYGIINGCGHAGIVNIFIDLLSRDKLITESLPLYFAFGGMHLDYFENTEKYKLKEIVYILKTLTKNHNASKTLRPLLLSLSHCSSSFEVANMFEKFGENDRLMCAKITSTGSMQKYGVSPA